MTKAITPAAIFENGQADFSFRRYSNFAVSASEKSSVSGFEFSRIGVSYTRNGRI